MTKPQELIVAEMDVRHEINLGRNGAQRELHHVSMRNKLNLEGMDFGQLGQKFGGPKMECEETFGLNNVLKVRWEKLMKSQVKYWVELDEEEEEEDVCKGNSDIIPLQTEAVGELTQGLKALSLKRKSDGSEELTLSMRRKDHNQDSPNSAGNRDSVVADLKAAEEGELPRRYRFSYDGALDFYQGSRSKEKAKPRHKVRKALFPSRNSNIQIVWNFEIFKENWTDDEDIKN